jgi:hypothetical protein
VKHDGDDILILTLSPEAQTRLDQKFVRKVVIGDLRLGALQEGQVLMSSSNKTCFQQ